MSSRMDKYKNDLPQETTITRSQKNEQLYKDIYANKRYTEFVELEKDNVMDITSSLTTTNNKSRSDFQRKRILYEDGFVSNDDYIDFSNVKISEPEEQIKKYNINDVLEEAKKNRNAISNEEKNRKIRNVEYSILTDLSQEKIKEFREKKEKPLSKDEEENLEELIHTITSKGLRKKIDDELLSDLMPETNEEPIISNNLLEQLDLTDKINNEYKKENNDNNIEQTFEKEIDKSFFTKSMDLKKEDLIAANNLDDEIDESFKEDKDNSVVKIIVIVTLIIGIIGILIYILMRFI